MSQTSAIANESPSVDRDSRLARVVDGDRFQAFIAGVIVLNALVLGAETYPAAMTDFGSVLVAMNELCFGIFVVELVLRIASYGRRPWDFFRNGWNIFDLIVIGGVLIPAVREQAQLLRLLRLARITRLVRFLPDARILILTVVKSIPSLFSMVVLTLLLLFIYGMIGWTLFGEALPQTWGNVGQAMLTCFVLLTLENFPTYLEAAQPVSPFATLFFVSYVLLAAFIVFNMLIGIVIGSMERAREAQAATERALDESGLLQRIADMRESMEVLEAEVTAQVIAARRDPSPGS